MIKSNATFLSSESRICNFTSFMFFHWIRTIPNLPFLACDTVYLSWIIARNFKPQKCSIFNSPYCRRRHLSVYVCFQVTESHPGPNRPVEILENISKKRANFGPVREVQYLSREIYLQKWNPLLSLFLFKNIILNIEE